MAERKGIIMAGGTGTRLYPITRAINKQLMPVYDKPMIYYPLSTLMLSGIQDILIISDEQSLPQFEALLGSGDQWGINLSYGCQKAPRGIAEALLIGKTFIGNNPSALILGDNLFYGDGMSEMFSKASNAFNLATVFGYYVHDPRRYGVIKFSPDDTPIEIVEKPTTPPSNWAVTGLYFYDSDAVNIAATLRPSHRGELEITDLNNVYLREGRLHVSKLGRGYAWLDTGTPSSMLDAANFISVVEARQGLKIASPEEISWRMGFINSEDFEKLAKKHSNCEYGQYLTYLLKRQA